MFPQSSQIAMYRKKFTCWRRKNYFCGKNARQDMLIKKVRFVKISWNKRCGH